jgi:hypothetical protein
MTVSKKRRLSVSRAVKKRPFSRAVEEKSTEPLELRVELAGDKRLAENVIIEVLAAARRCGLDPPSVQVIRQPKVGPKEKLTRGRKGR